jgi:hypothetical protein
MDVGINNIIYMELHSGPKMAKGTCGKTTVAGTIDRDSTVYIYIFIYNKKNKKPKNTNISLLITIFTTIIYKNILLSLCQMFTYTNLFVKSLNRSNNEM